MTTRSSDRWQELSPYLDRALELTGEARAAWLASLGERDPDVAAALRTLLDEHDALRDERFLDGRATTMPGGPAAAGQSIDAYRLVSPVGYGGMGTVWLAERSDGRFERRAAVKFLNVALAGRGEARFRREGRILGRLTHPHIAQLIDAGLTSDGHAYLVLEYVDGKPIDRYCDERALDVEGRVRLVLDVLAAVAHAHANLVVHRDLKPSNVLVTADGQVKLLDFGIARLIEDEAPSAPPTMLTRDGDGPFTPEYAAPEQLTGQPVTTATDVYAMGVLLYRLLTGRHPAGAALGSPASLLRAITEVDPPRPSEAIADNGLPAATSVEVAARRSTTPDRLRRALHGDLDRIVGKALKKSPHERYPTATALADDLRRYLANEPVLARPDTLRYRAGKFMRRNRAAVVLATVALVATIAGLAGTLVQARTAGLERDFALRQLSRAEAINDLDKFILSDAAPTGRPFTANELLSRAEAVVERQRGDEASRVALLTAIGDQYISQDEDASGRRALREAYVQSSALADIAIRARAGCAYGMALAEGGELPRGEALFQEGLRALPVSPTYALDRVFCLQKGSEIARLAGRTRDGIERIRAAQAALDGSPFRSEARRLSVLMDVAECFRVAGQLREANAAFVQASALLTALGRDNTQKAGTVFNNWGLVVSQLGRPRDADALFRRGIAISSAGDAEQAVSPMLLINEARVLRDLARLRDAADYAERGLAVARRADDAIVVNQSLLLLASVYRLQGNIDRALATLEEVEPRFRRTLPPGHVAFAAVMREHALIDRARGDFTRGLQAADEAVRLLETSINSGRQGRDMLPQLLLVRSDLMCASRRAAGAEADAARALGLMQATAERGAASSVIGAGYLSLGRALLAEEKHPQAMEAFRSAYTHLNDALGPDHPDTRTALDLLAHETGRR